MQIQNLSLVRPLLLVAFLLSGMCFMACVPNATADDHGHKSKHSDWNVFTDSGHGKGDDGNELTGETTAWIFAAANLPALLSLLLKGSIRHLSLAGNVKDRLKRFNQAQKKYLMPFHYILNPLALLLAVIHFSLSHCRSSSLPEWGLAVMATMAVVGILMKFKVIPTSLRKTVYQIHTNPLPVGILVIILLVGHSIVD